MKVFTDSVKLNISISMGIFISFMIFLSGIAYAYIGTLMPYHIKYLGLTEKDIEAFNPRLMYMLSALIRLYGIGNINLGILNLFIIYFGFKHKKKWAWFSTLIIGVIGFTATFILTYPIIGNYIIYKAFVFFAILGMVQLLLPFREFFAL